MNQALRLAPLASVLLAPALAHAGGFAVQEVNAQASGRGGTGVAIAESPSAIYFNPANIARLEGLRLEVGVALIAPRWEWEDPNGGGGPTKSEPGLVTPPSAFATYNAGDLGIGDVAFGVGFYVPFGATFSWPEGWEGAAEIESIGIQVFEISPALALRLDSKVSIGAGFRVLPSAVYLQRAVPFGSEQVGRVEMSGSAVGFGGSFGINIEPLADLNIGLSFRSSSTLNFEGESDFQFAPPFDALANDREVRTTVPLPNSFRLGASYSLLDQLLRLSADVEFQMWSSYEALTITLIDDEGTEETTTSPRNSRDSWVVRAGVEVRPLEALTVRAGYAYDQQTLPEDTVNPAPPDSVRHAVSVGLSYDFGILAAHAYFTNAFFVARTSRTSEFPGTWRGGWAGGTMAYLGGISLSTAFDFVSGSQSDSTQSDPMESSTAAQGGE